MSDLTIFPQRQEANGQRRYLIVSETEKGKKHLKEAFISVSEVVSIVLDNRKDLEELIEDLQAQELTVQVY